MDDSLIAVPGNIVLIISNQKDGVGSYAFVDDVVVDVKPNWWRITFQILLPTPDFKPIKKCGYWMINKFVDKSLRWEELSFNYEKLI